MSEVTDDDASDTTCPDTPLSVAVTGGIGAGKSTVSAAFAARGAVVIDADLLAREVVQPGTEGLAAIAAEFGPGVITQDGALDRAELAGIVFTDSVARARLEAIIHPLVRALFDRRLAAVPGDGIVVNDIPLIRTVRDAARYHLVIGVGIADHETRVQRLIARGHTEADATARIAAQISDDERRALADVWIDNSAAVADLAPAIDELWARLGVFAANRRAGSVGGGRSAPALAAAADLDRTALTAARVALACGGRVPVVAPQATAAAGAAQSAGTPQATGTPQSAGLPDAPVGLTMTVALDDAAQAERFRVSLQAAGFPPVGDRFGSADPGLSLSLYLIVRD